MIKISLGYEKWRVPKIHNYILTPKFIDLGNKNSIEKILNCMEYYMKTNNIDNI